MELKHINSDNLTRLGKIQNYLAENYDINVKNVLPRKKLDQAYQNVEKRLVNLRNKSNKFQQDPNYGMNIMVRDALGIMINEGLYYEGENYRKLMDELYEYGCSLAESGDDYDTVMDSCGKKYEAMPARYPKDMILAAISKELRPMFDGSHRISPMGDPVEEDFEDEVMDVIDDVEVDDQEDMEEPGGQEMYSDASEEMLAELIGEYLNKENCLKSNNYIIFEAARRTSKIENKIKDSQRLDEGILSTVSDAATDLAVFLSDTAVFDYMDPIGLLSNIAAGIVYVLKRILLTQFY